ncbi:hypothetical protein SAMN04488498_1772 [Mesorhizobium albiziae]|uniref:Uncharacterized protein n=1 Tax=Neomesorhizobium albiziae TaxID=335020 RepID=A0A1I4G2Y4_9HYPH|nr:hypothetical protein [Mesorhizobium albiziae]GLS34123.1 hypothetical protein GCM10007937_58370 [Mesorhizobium albiziae]SFL24099.1 hypothetical protein SAMN04488498_1772 [Mesorhizobium albiziae]
MNTIIAFLIAIGAPSVIAAVIAILRYLASGTLQSTVDFLVVVLLVCFPLVFYQQGLAGIYGISANTFHEGLQQVGILSGALAIFMIGWSIYWLEVEYSRYPTTNDISVRKAIAWKWRLALAATAALWGMHVLAALNGGGLPSLW